MKNYYSRLQQKFLEESQKIDFSRYLFTIPDIPKDLFLREKEYLYPSSKIKLDDFRLERLRYPDNPIELIIDISEKHKYLTPNGGFSSFMSDKEFLAARAYLFQSSFIAQFCDAYAWLQCTVPSFQYYRGGNSYTLKHRCENFVGRYVGNGNNFCGYCAGIKSRVTK